MIEPVHARADLRRWLLDGAAPRPRTDAEAGTLAAAAAEQGLVGLLHTDVVAQGVRWPGPEEALRRAHHAALARGVGQLDAAARVHALLRARGLRALPLKGAALAERLYDSVGHRPMADVDILALDDFTASVETLRDAGFTEAETADHARSFVDPESGTVVELHHSVTSPPGLFPVDAEGLWARSVTAPGQIARVPAVEDLLVQLALHAAFQHGLVLTLVQYLDFRRLFERASPRVDRLLDEAARAGALGALAAALRAAEAVVGLRLPGDLDRALDAALPAGLRGRIDDARRAPLLLVAPAVPSLARVRWALAAGRRLSLLTRTVGSPEPGAPRRLRHALLRAGALAWRWGPVTLRG